LLLITKDWAADWLYIVWAALSASIGVIALAAGLFGWLLGFAAMWQRALLVVAALCLIKPGLYTDMAGLALLAIVAAAQLFQRRRAAESGARA
jgi:TRAP-type uncharacterized transport system fused permease subunit